MRTARAFSKNLANYMALGQTSSYAAALNGTSQCFTVSDSSTLEFGSQDFTVSIWVYLGDASAKRTFLAKSNGAGSYSWEFSVDYVNGNVTFYPSSDGTNVTSSASVPGAVVGSWQLWTATRIAGTLNVYRNTTVGTSSTPNFTIFDSSAPLSIGAQNTSGTRIQMLVGSLAHVIVCNGYGATAADISYLYNAGLGRSSSEIISRFGANLTYYNSFSDSAQWQSEVGPVTNVVGLPTASVGNVGRIGALLNGAPYVSAHLWAMINSAVSSSTGNRFFGNLISGSGSPGITFGIDGTGNLLKVSARSVAGDSTQTVGATARKSCTFGQWHSVGLTIDYPNKLINIYLDGQLSSSTSVTFTNSAYTQGAATTSDDSVGANSVAPSSTDSQHDGALADIAIWRAQLGPRDFARLAKGVAPHKIRMPTVHLKLDGQETVARCAVGSGARGTPMGTVNATSGPRPDLSYLRESRFLI